MIAGHARLAVLIDKSGEHAAQINQPEDYVRHNRLHT